MTKLAEDPVDRLHCVVSQVNFLSECFSQKDSLNLSNGGREGLAETLNSISDQITGIAEEVTGKEVFNASIRKGFKTKSV